MSKIEEVKGQKVVIRFEASRCIHSRNCVLGQPEVFVANAPGAWIHPDRATPGQLAALAESCPSGAITYERLDGGPNEAPPKINVLRLRENGPLAVHAPTRLEGRAIGLRVTLCRCGASKAKPYCDGSHQSIGFNATGEAPTQPSTPPPRRDGPLELMPIADGPLRFVGPFEIVAGSGRTVDRCSEAFLCRCGASANKPYCDGSHKKIGFKSD